MTNNTTPTLCANVSRVGVYVCVRCVCTGVLREMGDVCWASCSSFFYELGFYERKVWTKEDRGRRYGRGQHSVPFSQTNMSMKETEFQCHSCFISPSLLAECCRKVISKALSYLPPRWPTAASGWWGWCGGPPQWLKLFSWQISLLHKQWGWMQEPVDLGCPQRQQQRAFRDTCTQNRAQLSCLTSCPCWQWQILTTEIELKVEG